MLFLFSIHLIASNKQACRSYIGGSCHILMLDIYRFVYAAVFSLSVEPKHYADSVVHLITAHRKKALIIQMKH